MQIQGDGVYDQPSFEVVTFRDHPKKPIIQFIINRTDDGEKVADVMKKVIELVSSSEPSFKYYRFRRVSKRKNRTKRPGIVISENIAAQKYKEFCITHNNSRFPMLLYLEESPIPFQTVIENALIVSVVVWNQTDKSTLPDKKSFEFEKTSTLAQVKEIVCKFYNLDTLTVKIIQEEDYKIFEEMEVLNDTLEDLAIGTGDILHFQAANEEIWIASYYAKFKQWKKLFPVNKFN